MKKCTSISFLFIFTIILFFITPVNAEPAATNRLWGNDRYQTCSEIVKEGWKSSDYAVIVNGENYPDALSASVLAKKYKAPILLSQSNTLGYDTKDQLYRLKVKKAFIVGGSFVLNPSVETELQSIGIATERFSGADRYDTSIAVAKQIGVGNGIILTTGENFTDALSASPIAAKLQIPIILVPKNALPASTANFLLSKGIPKTYVLGGTDIISDEVSNKFSNVKRIEGNNEYERNINIIKEFEENFDFTNVCLAYSEKFADALSGSAYAALQGNPIVLLGDDVNSYTKSFLGDKASSTKITTVFGGTAGIKENQIYNIFDKLSGDDSILNSIKNSSIYNFELKDEKGEKYKVYIFSEDYERKTASFEDGSVWAGASEGDTLYTGTFKIAAVKNDTGYIKVESISNTTFNVSRPLVRAHNNLYEGNPDLLLIGAPAASNASVVKAYCIKDGSLQLLKVYGGDEVGTEFYTFNSQSLFFRQTGENAFEISGYNNAGNPETYFMIFDLSFDKTNCSLTYSNSRKLSMDEYYQYIKKEPVGRPIPDRQGNKGRLEFDEVQMAGLKLDMSKNDLFKIKGEAQGTISDNTETYVYKDFTVQCWNYGEEYGGIGVFRISTTNSNIKGPRDIKVGDSVEDVLSKFPNEDNSIVNGSKYLYGKEYDYSGQATYDSNGNITALRYIAGTGTFSVAVFDLKIEDNKVSEITIWVPPV